MSEHEPPRPEAPDQVVTDHIDHRGTSDRDRVISPAVIGEYISFDQCPRYFKHKGQDIDHSWFHEGEDFEEAFQALNLLLSKAGKDFEQAVLEDLSTAETDEHTFARDSDEFESDATALVEILVTACEADPAPTGPSILYQTSLTGQIGVWHVGGDADIILVWATEEGAHIRVLDAKSTREEKPYHQIQAAAYADLINGLITDRADLDRATITIDAGIVSRESEFESPTQDGVPSFDVAPRIMDIRRLLGPDGELTDLAGREFDDVSYQLNEKCARCSFNEACVTDAFEEGHLRLLGLSTAQQETLAAHGVESVADVAELCNPLSEKKWHPEHYPAASFSKPIYDEIKSISGIGELLPTLVYRAQALCDSFDPETDGITDRPQTWIPGTGRCDLPEDNPPDTTGIEHDWLHGSMIRIYVNVQTDHLRDRLIQVSGRVTATASTTEAQRFSILSEAAPTDTEASLRTEKALLAAFIDQLYDAIRAVNAGIDYGESVQTDPPIHVYFYTEHERSALDDAFERHDSDIIT